MAKVEAELSSVGCGAAAAAPGGGPSCGYREGIGPTAAGGADGDPSLLTLMVRWLVLVLRYLLFVCVRLLP